MCKTPSDKWANNTGVGGAWRLTQGTRRVGLHGPHRGQRMHGGGSAAQAPREAVYIFWLAGRRGVSPPAGKRHSAPAPRAPGPSRLGFVQLLSKRKTKEEMKLCGGNSALLSKDQVFTSTCTLQSLLTGWGRWQPAAHAFWLFQGFFRESTQVHACYIVNPGLQWNKVAQLMIKERQKKLSRSVKI